MATIDDGELHLEIPHADEADLRRGIEAYKRTQSNG